MRTGQEKTDRLQAPTQRSFLPHHILFILPCNTALGQVGWHTEQGTHQVGQNCRYSFCVLRIHPSHCVKALGHKRHRNAATAVGKLRAKDTEWLWVLNEEYWTPSPPYSCTCSSTCVYFRAESIFFPLWLFLDSFCFCKPWKLSHHPGREVFVRRGRRDTANAQELSWAWIPEACLKKHIPRISLFRCYSLFLFHRKLWQKANK